MDYLLLGNSGLRVSPLCLGAMTFGSEEPWCADKAESRAMFEAFVEAGGNFIDTADIYTGGESERLVGEFIAADRDRFVVATKYTNNYPGSGDPNACGNHRKNLTQSLDASLERLGVDYIESGMRHARAGRCGPGRQDQLCGSLRYPRLGDCPRQYPGAMARLGAGGRLAA